MKRIEKARKRDEKVEKAAARRAKAESSEVALLPFLALRSIPFFLVFGIGYAVAASNVFYSETEKKMHIAPRLIFFFLSQATASDFFVLIGLHLARAFLGESSNGSWEMRPEEVAVHDNTIPWPEAEYLDDDLKRFVSTPGQPFHLNHVTGRRRCKDAFMRVGMSLSTCITVWCMCIWMDNRSLASLGMTMDRPFFTDLIVGFGVGVTIVAVMFIIELGAGWLHFLRFLEVFDKTESFGLCIFWDVMFHINVSLNEELPVRGWMLFNVAEALMIYLDLGYTSSMVASIGAESLFFVCMHLPSPGGTRPLSMANIFIGGIAGGLNVLLTGGRLGFALGWHFGWNISMGNVFGLSTSGIPISATFIAVAPHPEKESYHGGVFGPEGGVVSPLAYLLGIVLLVMFYGTSGGALLSQ